ncbi:MAG: chromosomal replication initiator DnaA [Rhodomicrobium sp.]|nr:chromosomal replication initiator DnaA [Rhodomicrobium sp.]
MPRREGGEDEPSPLSREIAAEAMQIACEALNAPFIEMTAPGRKKAKVAFARQLAMYLCHVVGQMALAEISLVFGRDRTTAGYACHMIEDRRDAPLFDAQVEYLEVEMRERMHCVLARFDRAHLITEGSIRRARMRLAK